MEAHCRPVPPKDHSVNDGIPKYLCSLKYITIDEAIKGLGQGTLLANIDIKSAFCLIPVHPVDRYKIERRGVHWHLPSFWAEVGSQTVQFLAEFLTWIIRQSNVPFLIQYLDDFLTMGPLSSPTCQHNLDTIIQICDYLGVPLALEKVDGPLTTLPFLGIVLDTTRMEARLPEDKLLKLRQDIAQWISYTDTKKHDILSLVGSLQHAAKIVCCGRAFESRMYAMAAKVKELHFYM